MDIDGLGGKLLDQLAREGLITDPASLWDLEADRLAELPGWGETSAGNLIRELERARDAPLGRLLFALGLPHVGERAAAALAHRFGSLEALMSATAEELEAIEGVGPVMAAAVREWLEDPDNVALLDRLRQRGVDPRQEVVEADAATGPLEGLIFVITGTLSRPRDQIRQRLEDLGAKVATSVSGRTSALVAGEATGSKLDKARQLGVPIVDEDELDEMVRDRSGRRLWEQ
jgi:DNA ligase (NAD+)